MLLVILETTEMVGVSGNNGQTESNLATASVDKAVTKTPTMVCRARPQQINEYHRMYKSK
jgi:hypothetical protein